MSQFTLHPQLEQDCYVVTDLELCRVLLMNNSHYPWCILVPMRAALREIYELKEAEQCLLIGESSRLSRLMMARFAGEKMNVAALGNMVPQLHVHHIVRRQSDNAWPGPVWGRAPALPYSEQEAGSLCETLRTGLR
ncbi:MAG: HIT domain-containing protein [Gammaproteobacteria bacterium]